jgi:hypothetical protein
MGFLVSLVRRQPDEVSSMGLGTEESRAQRRSGGGTSVRYHGGKLETKSIRGPLEVKRCWEDGPIINGARFSRLV